MQKEYLLKTTSYLFSVFQGVLYTPIILSFAFFIIAIPLLIKGGDTNALIRLLPSGDYTGSDVIAIYGKFAFAGSLIIAIAETALKKRFTISIKKKTFFVGLVLLIGYSALAGLFIYKAHLPTGTVIFISLSMLIFSLLFLFASALVSIFVNFISKAFKFN